MKIRLLDNDPKRQVQLITKRSDGMCFMQCLPDALPLLRGKRSGWIHATKLYIPQDQIPKPPRFPIERLNPPADVSDPDEMAGLPGDPA